jgi:RNA-directed DNA polymerase
LRLPLLAPLRHADGLRECLFIGVGRKWPDHGQNDAIDRAPRGRELSVREVLTRIIVDLSGSWQAARLGNWLGRSPATDVVDADLSKYFDTIPHSELMKSVARRVVDRNVLRLIKMWLRAPIEERDADGTRRMSGGKRNTRGTPQGGVASPLLANIYMNRFLKHWRLTGCGDTFHAHVVSYADDFVILSRGRAAEALAWTKAVMTKLGLTINEAKTSLRNARQERFDFLGYSFGAHRFEANGNWYLGASPSKKSVQRLKTRIGDLLVPSNIDPWPEVRDKLNRSLRGWSNYFGYGSRSKAYRSIDQYNFERVRRFLARRHKVQGRGNRRFTFDVIH